MPPCSVALVYDLKADYLARGFTPEAAAEFDEPETVDALESALAALGFSPVRVGGAESLARRLSAGERWDWAFPIAEGWRGACREAQAASLLDLFGVPHVFSDALALAVMHHKGTAKRLAASHGVPTAPFAVVDRPDGFRRLGLPFPLFVKPVAEGSSKGIGDDARVDDLESLERVGRRLLAEFAQPVLVEAYLPGEEYTVAVSGQGVSAAVWGAMRIEFAHPDAGDAYSLRTKADYRRLVRYHLADPDASQKAGGVALAAHRALGARDMARYDVRMDARGQAMFLEGNPLPGLNPGYSDLPILAGLLGREYGGLVRDIVARFAH